MITLRALHLMLHRPGPSHYWAEGMATVACYYLGNAVPTGVLSCTFHKITGMCGKKVTDDIFIE
jgi:hypothetical protein